MASGYNVEESRLTLAPLSFVMFPLAVAGHSPQADRADGGRKTAGISL